MRLRQRARLGFELGRAHVLCRRVDQVADLGDRRRLGQRGLDRLGLAGQQHPRARGLGCILVAIEAVLCGDPAVERRPRLALGAAVSALGQNFGQPRQS